MSIARRDVLSLAGLAAFGPLAAAAQTPGKGGVTTPDRRRAELYGLLGDLPDRRRPIAGKKRQETKRDRRVLDHQIRREWRIWVMHAVRRICRLSRHGPQSMTCPPHTGM